MHRSTNVLGALSIGAAVWLAGFLIGISVGQSNPPAGKMLVSTERGVPADLPRWACQELVWRRLRDAAVVAGQTPPPFFHYSIRECPDGR